MAFAVRRWVTDVALLTKVAWHQFREDPAWLFVQGARQAPARVRRRLRPGPTTRPGVISSLRAVLADKPEQARELVVGHEARAGFLRTQLGLEAPAGDRVGLARVAAVRGELSEAVAVGAGTPVARRAASELRLLSPGFQLSPRPSPQRPRQSSGIHRRVAMILNNSLPHTQSGYAQRTHSLLTAMRASGIEVEAWTRLGWPASVGRLGTNVLDVIDGVPYHRLPTPSFSAEHDRRWQQQVDRLIPELAEFAPDVIHTTTDFHNGLVAQAVAASLGVPWVYELRGQIELSWAAQRPAPWREQARSSERVLLARAKELELARAADAVVVLSQVQADDLLDHGVEPRALRIAPNAVDDTLLDHDIPPVEARRLVGLPEDGCWVGAVSSLNGYEGHDVLLRAVALARRDGQDIRCAIVGDGPAMPELEALGSALGLGHALVMPGRVPRRTALDWYAALDVFVVPRRDIPLCRVITPMKPLEAMAMGRPVVASDLPALRTIVDGDAGVLVPAENTEELAAALTSLAQNPARRTALGRGAHAAATERTWAHNAATCQSLYDGLLRDRT